ncbi:ABC-type transport system substrate-binding protein [Pedobacter sp. UYP30]
MAIVKNSPLGFKRVRQAINYAIDRDQLVKYLRNGIGIAATSGFIPKGMPGFDDKEVKGYSYNPTKAAKLLAEAGFPNGKGLPEITLNTTTTYKDLIEFIQGSLNAIGIQTKIDVSPSTSLRELMAKNHVNFFRGSWLADYADGETFLSVFYSKNKVPFGQILLRITTRNSINFLNVVTMNQMTKSALSSTSKWMNLLWMIHQWYPSSMINLL